jgi:hypothetical protein
MSANKHRPHVLVLPEDDANGQLANGFALDVSTRQLQVLEPAGGWMKVLECFKSDHVREMARCPLRSMVLLIDFDGAPERLSLAKAFIPDHLMDRVFVLGVLTEPEKLSADLGRPPWTIGEEMAKDCREEVDGIWGHDLLRHNSGEIGRLRKRVRPFLFQIER